ncbi:MAG: NAD-dependent dihydropyrimidine dehydrogenase subunit PreA [Lachnospiraceae bacterium]|nr:NAD-dependent dihydropyrimidine dehydrogenase subunit PreA [Candidatus Colinaster equi]
MDNCKCMICHDAPCRTACDCFDPARVLRAKRFENEGYILSEYQEGIPCKDCDGHCKADCPIDVPIKETICDIYDKTMSPEILPMKEEVDISCDICGVKLENPFILASSVVASTFEMCDKAFSMGWAGVAYKTICLMDIHEASPRFSVTKNSDGSFAGFKNIEQLSDHSLEENMEIFRRLKAKHPTKVIIASIMGRNEGEWEYLSRAVTEAGADVVELNFSCPNMEAKGVGVDIGQVPELCKRFTAAARRGTNLPILAKMTPNITDIRVPARASIEGGADGIAAINTIKSITGVNLDTLVAAPSVHGKASIGGYSGRAVKPIALRYISELSSDEVVGATHISGIGGIYSWHDACEFLTLGARSLQVATAVMEYGYRIIDDLVTGLKYFLYQRGYNSVSEIINAASDSVVDTSDIERDTILFPVFDAKKCTGCGRCYLSCADGGHQAIKFDESTRRPKLDGAKCVGCHLCLLVCPNGAIKYARRRIDSVKKDDK